MLLTIGALVVAAAGLGTWQLMGGGSGRSGGGAVRVEQIALLPLVDQSRQDELFASTLLDALISAIARDADVGVVSRTAVQRAAGTDATSAEIATSLGVQGVMEGSIFRTGSVMRIIVQLVEPTTLRYIWTGTYERDVTNVLGAQDELVRTIASELGAALTTRNSNIGS